MIEYCVKGEKYSFWRKKNNIIRDKWYNIIVYSCLECSVDAIWLHKHVMTHFRYCMAKGQSWYMTYIYINIDKSITLLILGFKTWKCAQIDQHPSKYFGANYQSLKMCLKFSDLFLKNNSLPPALSTRSQDRVLRK